MKKITALMLTVFMFTIPACSQAFAGEAAQADSFVQSGYEDIQMSSEKALPAEPEEAVTQDHLTAAGTNPLWGQFFTDLWGNITSDQDVRRLIHAYDLVYWNGEEGKFTYDPSVVSGMAVTENTAGDHTYTFVLYEDLYYSDGTPVTAWDYAFSFLLQIAPEIAYAGANPAHKEQLLGYQAYIDGDASYLAGVRVLSDYTLSVTVDHEYLPFFYEMALVRCNPYPVQVIAPGVEVRDDGLGVYLANIDDTAEEPLFTGELLKETLLNEETGYQSHPSVVTGPYVLTSWDGETAEFERNPYYKGNEDGVLPSVQFLTYKTADNASMIEGLADGEYDLLNKVVSKDAVEDGLALLADEETAEQFGMSTYPRTGMSFISFACEKEALSQPEVRKAIAWCLDRDAVVSDYTGDRGVRADGYYGIGQWMYGILDGTVAPPAENEEERAAYEELSLEELTVYQADADTAAALLEEAGWKLNDEGIREKEIDGELITLELTLVYPEGSSIAESLEEYFVPNLEKAGIHLELSAEEPTTLLSEYYNPQERTADLIFLASNFEEVFDPSAYFVTEIDEQTGEERHIWLHTGCADEELYEAAAAMRRTEPGDVLTYMKHWIEFEKRFNEVLPVLPVYSNYYFDFYTADLHNYRIAESSSWADAVVSAYLGGETEENKEDNQ